MVGPQKFQKNIDIDYLDFNKLYKVIVKNKIDFVIVGPEQPLIKGIVDFLKEKSQGFWTIKICCST